MSLLISYYLGVDGKWKRSLMFVKVVNNRDKRRNDGLRMGGVRMRVSISSLKKS